MDYWRCLLPGLSPDLSPAEKESVHGPLAYYTHCPLAWTSDDVPSRLLWLLKRPERMLLSALPLATVLPSFL